MAEPISLRHLSVSLAVSFLIGGSALLEGCQPGSEITEYQAPAQILRTFRAEHPAAQAVSYRQVSKDGVKVYCVQYLEGEEEKESWYNVQGRPFVSKAERRAAEQERLKQQEESETKAREEAEGKPAQPHEAAPQHPAEKPTSQSAASSRTNVAVP